MNIEPTWFKTLARESKSKLGVCPALDVNRALDAYVGKLTKGNEQFVYICVARDDGPFGRQLPSSVGVDSGSMPRMSSSEGNK